MEACYSSHFLGREIAKLGHDTKLIPAQHVTPFVLGNKNDHNDAFAIAEASQRANIRFVQWNLNTSKKYHVYIVFVNDSSKTKPPWVIKPEGY